MGQSMVALKSQGAEQEQNDKEMLAMLEKMAQAQPTGKVQTILHRSSDDEEIHKGTVVANLCGRFLQTRTS